MKKFKKYFTATRIMLYIVFLLFFMILPVNAVEGRSFCTWYNSFGIICATCGYTRGFTFFMHGLFDKAFMYNPVLVLFAAPSVIFIMLQDIFVIIKRNIKKQKQMSFIEFILRPDIYFGR